MDVSGIIGELRSLRARITDAERRMTDAVPRLVELVAPPRPRRSRAAFDAAYRPLAVIRNEILTAIMAADRLLADLARIGPTTMAAADVRTADSARLANAEARQRLLLWAPLGHAIDEAVSFGRAPLFQDQVPSRLDLRDHLIRQLSEAFGSLHAVVNPLPQDAAAETGGGFADIPMPAARFANLALAAWRLAQAVSPRDSLRFLDVGCGGGLRVVQAAQLFDRADGIDFDPGYVRSARRLLKRAGPTRCAAVQADGRTFARYHDYDVIYVYRPMRDPDGLKAIEQRILTTARPGTVVIAPYDTFVGAPLAARVEDCLHVVGLPANRSARLLKAAEAIGCRCRNPGETPWWGTRSFPDLARALNRSGFAVGARS